MRCLTFEVQLLLQGLNCVTGSNQGSICWTKRLRLRRQNDGQRASIAMLEPWELALRDQSGESGVKKKQACTMAAYMVTILINWVSWATYFWEGLCMSATRYHKVIWVTCHLLPEIIWCVPLPLPTNLTKDLRIHKSLWAGHSWCSEKVLTRVLEKLDPDLK